MVSETETLIAIDGFTRMMRIKQADLSELTGISRVHINRVFKGRLLLTDDVRAKLADGVRLAILSQSDTTKQSPPVGGSSTQTQKTPRPLNKGGAGRTVP
jgi:hypothetical protein